MTTYATTLMEKLLGRNYKWWYLLNFNLKKELSRGSTFSLWTLASLIEVWSFVYLWKFVVKNDELATYTFIGHLFSKLVVSWVQWDVATDIYQGKLATKLLRPSSIMGTYFINSISNKVFENLTYIFIASVSVFLIFDLSVNVFDFLIYLLMCLIF